MKKIYLVCNNDYNRSPLFATDDKAVATFVQHKIYSDYDIVELPFLSSFGWYREDNTAATKDNNIDKDFEVVDDNE